MCNSMKVCAKVCKSVEVCNCEQECGRVSLCVGGCVNKYIA